MHHTIAIRDFTERTLRYLTRKNLIIVAPSFNMETNSTNYLLNTGQIVTHGNVVDLAHNQVFFVQQLYTRNPIDNTEYIYIPDLCFPIGCAISPILFCPTMAKLGS